MKQNQIDKGRFIQHGEGLGTVTEEMVQKRARELALISGRQNVLDSDTEQARRELLGEERLNPPPTRAESLPEDQRWDPVPASTGEKTPVTPPPDEQTFAERLVEEGVEDAEQDQMVKATKQSIKREPPE
jgi:hypothetical protein